MKNPVGKKLVLVALSCILMVGLVNAVLAAGSYLRDRAGYVEVGGGKLAYVPRTAQFVKVDGRVKRIVKFASTVSAAEASCQCPKCCNGFCYVFVYTDSLLGGSSILSLSYIWVEC